MSEWGSVSRCDGPQRAHMSCFRFAAQCLIGDWRLSFKSCTRNFARHRRRCSHVRRDKHPHVCSTSVRPRSVCALDAGRDHKFVSESWPYKIFRTLLTKPMNRLERTKKYEVDTHVCSTSEYCCGHGFVKCSMHQK